MDGISLIKIENVDVFGWEAAIRGMRNPKNSHEKSDSSFSYDEYSGEYASDFIGENDLKLMKNLCKAGPDHRKFLRMINVTCDIVAPLYWWKEYETYKVGTVTNSCSTMHMIHAKEFTLDDFSHEHLLSLFKGYEIGIKYNNEYDDTPLEVLEYVIHALNKCREKYLETKDKTYWYQMIQLLPSSYNQRRTVQLNYEVLLNMYHARKDHKLDCWKNFCKWMIETLPYFKEICLGD